MQVFATVFFRRRLPLDSNTRLPVRFKRGAEISVRRIPRIAAFHSDNCALRQR